MEPFFIDTGGVDLLVNPSDKRVLKFWERFPEGTKHFLCHIVYWEYLRQFKPNGNSIYRQRFVRLVRQESFEFLQFEKDAADIAVNIYTRLTQRLRRTQGWKLKLKDMHCDIMIAAIAVWHKKPVLTQDIGDWAMIKSVIEGEKLGTLRVSDQRDICG